MTARTPDPGDDREQERGADDIDARFAEITAGLDEITLPPAASADGTTDDDRPQAPGASSAQEPEPPRPAPSPRGTPTVAGSGPRDYSPAVGPDEEGFAPPEPGPISGGDPVLTLAWVAVVAPVVLVLAYLMLWRSMPYVLLGLGGVAFALGTGTLVWRMPGRRDSEDPDDGAVV